MNQFAKVRSSGITNITIASHLFKPVRSDHLLQPHERDFRPQTGIGAGGRAQSSGAGAGACAGLGS